MKVHFRIYLIVWIVGSSQILLDCVWPFELRFYWKNESSSFSDGRDMKLNEVIITCDQVIGLRLDPHYGKRAESPITVP